VISRRHIRLVIALLLPLMVLRAMLPAGYMPVAENGELRMVMCSAGLQLPVSNDTEQGKHHSTADTPCPFANVLTSAPPVQYVATVIVAAAEFRFTSLTTDTLPPPTGPPRITAARAPPALS